MVAAGGQGFDGQAAALRHLLDDFSSVTRRLRQPDRPRSPRPSTASTSWGRGWHPRAADAQALTNLAQTVTALLAAVEPFATLLQSLDSLAGQGRHPRGRLPPDRRPAHALGAVAQQLAGHQQDLAGPLDRPAGPQRHVQR